MKRLVTDAARGALVVLCLAMATPASALNRIHDMASPASGRLYMQTTSVRSEELPS